MALQIYAAFAGLLMAYSHDQTPWSAVAGIALISYLVRDKKPREVLKLALTFATIDGISFWSFLLSGADVFGVSWLMHVSFRIIFVMGLPYAYARPRLLPLTIASWWVAVEYTRTVLKLNPAPLGDAFAHQNWFIQIADLGGTYLVSFALTFIASSLALAYHSKRVRALIPAITMFLLCTSYSAFRLNESPKTSESQPRKIAIMQAALPTWFYGLAHGDQEFSNLLLTTYSDSLSKAPKDTDLLVWPETALPWDPSKHEQLRNTLSSTVHPNLIAGLPRHRLDGMNFNSAWFFPNSNSQPKSTVQYYDKRIKVPVVEASLGHGKKANLLGPEQFKVATIICWESVFPDLLAHATKSQFIAVLSDAGALGRSNMAELHARKTTLRAIERQRPTIHASQIGPSRLIDPKGRIVAQTTDWETTLLEGQLDAGWKTESIYSKTKGGFAPVISLLAFILLPLSIRAREQ
jgi:apolipoprotein N-acyltransferase